MRTRNPPPADRNDAVVQVWHRTPARRHPFPNTRFCPPDRHRARYRLELSAGSRLRPGSVFRGRRGWFRPFRLGEHAVGQPGGAGRPDAQHQRRPFGGSPGRVVPVMLSVVGLPRAEARVDESSNRRANGAGARCARRPASRPARVIVVTGGRVGSCRLSWAAVTGPSSRVARMCSDGACRLPFRFSADGRGR